MHCLRVQILLFADHAALVLKTELALVLGGLYTAVSKTNDYFCTRYMPAFKNSYTEGNWTE